MPLSDPLVQKLWHLLCDDIDAPETFPAKRPLLAHYTSIATLEGIMRSGELWFSNPLLMNDLEEVQFGINESAWAFRNTPGVRDACRDQETYLHLLAAFDECVKQFGARHLPDTYVFCLSEHDPADADGLLSMWRGYGANGGGAAVIFDSSKINYLEESPFIVSRVSYASSQSRRGWIQGKISQACEVITREKLTRENMPKVAHMLFERFKIFALLSKHHGFAEEREWRVIYMPDRDQRGLLSPMLSYAVSFRGIEPKLKFRVAPLPELFADDLSLEKVIDHILLGPSTSGPLSFHAVRRMLQSAGRSRLAESLRASTTPYRAIS
jgi:hypothetical protein